MRLPKTAFQEGLICHVYNHSIPESNLFNDHEDYVNLRDRFIEKIEIYPTVVFSYCFMPNHFHFLMRQESDIPIYRVFNDCFSGYVQYFNKKNERKGRLFQKHLQHKAILSSLQLIQTAAYSHRKPVKDGFTDDPGNWKYNNYPNPKNSQRLGIKGFGELLKLVNMNVESYKTIVRNYESLFTNNLNEDVENEDVIEWFSKF